ncbi:MAG: M1 family metallopeptidase [Gemmatimonadota bacterium]
MRESVWVRWLGSSVTAMAALSLASGRTPDLFAQGNGASAAAEAHPVWDGSSLVVDYPVYEAVHPPAAYQTAIDNGTRSPDGRPGPDYWQQQVDYRIDVGLEPSTARLTGSETIRIQNNSPGPIQVAVLHLYQNLFSEGVRRNRPVTLTGGIELTRVATGGKDLGEIDARTMQQQFRSSERDGGYLVQGTIAQVLFPTAVESGASIELEVEWGFDVSGGGGMRMGRLDHDVFNLAQWYPQVAVFDDVFGQDASPYLGNGEFYDEYGSFDVAVTVPEGWLVVGTGELTNGEEVLRPEALARLRSAPAVDTVVHVVSAEDLSAGRATRESASGTLTWRFHADSVRDFAFATSGKYVLDATGADTGGPRGRVLIQNVYDPAVEHWAEATLYAKHAIELFSAHLIPYPYPHATTAYGPPEVGGMEYPMITFINRSSPGRGLNGVVTHELGHFWMPMVVGSKEMAYAWMDEGFTQFNASRAMGDYYGDENARNQDRNIYLQAVRFGLDTPIMEHTDYVENGFGRGVAAYMKPASVMHALRHMLGDDTFDAAFSDYARAWAFKHPMPWDFFSMMEEAAGTDLDWFWQGWFYGDGELDQAIDSVTPAPGGITISLSNLGEVVMPVELTIQLVDGSETEVVLPVDAWTGTRTISRTLAVSDDVAKVTIDPGSYYPDRDRSNNEWKAEN